MKKITKTEREALFLKKSRIVLKVGSAVLASSENGLDQNRIERLAEEVSRLLDQGREVIMVSSGAIAAGLEKLGLPRKKGMPLSMKQAAAAIGQSRLMWIYEKTFSSFGRKVAQVLLTREDLSNRRRFLNARNTIQTLLDYHVVPIINENDTVSVDEIKFGDNDNLSGMVVHLADADMLIILSDIDGLYTTDPKKDTSAVLIPVVEKITAELERGAGDARSAIGTGGMRSKIMTAKKVGAFGVPMAIINGKEPGLLQALFEGREVGTLFLPHSRTMDSRKHWIAYTVCSTGRILVDDGAREALTQKGRSLLPGGIVKVEGSFKPGECVTCIDRTGRVIARGLIKYSSQDLDQIKGLKTSQISSVLGHKDYDEVIHRDDLVLL